MSQRAKVPMNTTVKPPVATSSGLRRASIPRQQKAHSPGGVHDIIDSPGKPLDPSTRSFMEPRFGFDFSKVRVHTDATAAKSATALGANAYTVGQHIVFGSERYRPADSRGRQLIAHELAHVIQQNGVATPTIGNGAIPVSTNLTAEGDAASAGRDVSGGRCANIRPAAISNAVIQRQAAAEPELGTIESLLIDGISSAASPLSGTGKRMIAATLRGLTLEIEAQIAAGKGDQLWSKLKELCYSPKEALQFAWHYSVGFVEGFFSPITGLYQLVKFVAQFDPIQAVLLSSTWQRRGELAGSLARISGDFGKMPGKLKSAVSGLIQHPYETVSALEQMLNSLGARAEEAAVSGGHKIGRMAMAQLDKPLPELGESAGNLVGEAVVNFLLFMFTDGIGNAISQVASKLGELASVLGRFGKVAEVLGTIIGELTQMLGVIGEMVTEIEQMIAKVAEVLLKPLQPVLEEVGQLLGDLRAFLRELLGVAEKESVAAADAAAAAAAKQAPHNAPHPNAPVPHNEPLPPGSPKPGPIRRVIKGGGQGDGRPIGRLHEVGKEPPPPHTPSPPKAQPHVAEKPLLKTGTDDVPVTTRHVEPPSHPEAGGHPTVASANKAGGGGRAQPSRPNLRSVKNSEGTFPKRDRTPLTNESDHGLHGMGEDDAVSRVAHSVDERTGTDLKANIPPDEPYEHVDPRVRGYAVEDMHLDQPHSRDFEPLPDWYKKFDAVRGGNVRTIKEGGKIIREIRRPDVLSVKSTRITEPGQLRAKVMKDIAAARGAYFYERSGVRIVGAAERRLDLVFEEGADVSRDTIRVLEDLKKEAGSIRFNWYVIKYGKEVPGPEFFKTLAKTLKEL